MNEVELNKQAKLSPHFSLGELTKTSYYTSDGNIPSHVGRGIIGRTEIYRWGLAPVIGRKRRFPY